MSMIVKLNASAEQSCGFIYALGSFFAYDVFHYFHSLSSSGTMASTPLD